MKNGKKVYYWDANIFLTACKKEAHVPDILQGASNVLEMLDKGDCILVTSVITRIEFLEAVNEKASKIFNEILQRSNVFVQQVTEPIVEKAREVRYHCREAKRSILKVPDAIHAATAILMKVDELHTHDGDLLKLSDLLDEVYHLKVNVPPIPAQGKIVFSTTKPPGKEGKD